MVAIPGGMELDGRCEPRLRLLRARATAALKPQFEHSKAPYANQHEVRRSGSV